MKAVFIFYSDGMVDRSIAGVLSGFKCDGIAEVGKNNTALLCLFVCLCFLGGREVVLILLWNWAKMPWPKI